ncbi:MAG: undecaprenyl/decaprenyl-phosphate alpha-N-acetylglucosaminyl 1-phosphate transferase [Desulfobacteraceae bacterium]|nr:MAG: undecaprenyl/decaprenyl-phosphate alpha-N-acetylglucosaminyl 1-phosphate transferase [Desulfobacteraceae bacterium]
MTRIAFLTHILFAAGLFTLSCIVCYFMAKRVQIMDIPNDRSSHDTPVPKSGGIVIVITFLCGVISIYLFGDATLIRDEYFFGFLFSALFIAVISFYDDIADKSFFFKLVSHIIAAGVVIASGIVIREIALPWVGQVQLGLFGYFLTFLWIIGLTNAYNFMDGLNGMAAGPAVINGLFFCVLSYSQGSTFVYIICYTIIAGALGFLVFNFPVPRLFMGDVGSAFLGFVFSTLGIIAALYDHSHTSLFVMPLLLFNFIYDTSFTFVRRLLKRENVFSAHRTHLYQLFNQLGYSHVQVSCFHFGQCIAQGIGAYVMINIYGSNRVFVFIPFLLFQILYSIVIVSKARKKNLI